MISRHRSDSAVIHPPQKAAVMASQSLLGYGSHKQFSHMPPARLSASCFRRNATGFIRKAGVCAPLAPGQNAQSWPHATGPGSAAPWRANPIASREMGDPVRILSWKLRLAPFRSLRRKGVTGRNCLNPGHLPFLANPGGMCDICLPSEKNRNPHGACANDAFDMPKPKISLVPKKT